MTGLGSHKSVNGLGLGTFGSLESTPCSVPSPSHQILATPLLIFTPYATVCLHDVMCDQHKGKNEGLRVVDLRGLGVGKVVLACILFPTRVGHCP